MLGIPRNGIGGGAHLEPFLRDDAAFRNGCTAVSPALVWTLSCPGFQQIALFLESLRFQRSPHRSPPRALFKLCRHSSAKWLWLHIPPLLCS